MSRLSHAAAADQYDIAAAEARKSLEKEWEAENRRKADLIECMQARGWEDSLIFGKLYAALCAERDAFVEAGFGDTMDAMADAAAEAADPYAYRGLRRSDFL